MAGRKGLKMQTKTKSPRHVGSSALVRRHVEVVTLSFDVRLEYQSDAGREYLVASLKRDARVDMGGGGDVGMYGMKSVEGTARVTPNYGNQRQNFLDGVCL